MSDSESLHHDGTQTHQWHPFWTTADGLPADVICHRTLIANIVFLDHLDEGAWILVDAGVHGFGEAIERAAVEAVGRRAPSAIVLTHAHFDHVGSLPHLIDIWDCPIFVHPAELPYVTGEAEYPPADPTVGGGLMSALSPLYPRSPLDVADRVRPLPTDGSVPFAPAWHWIHTPGHTAGHVSLFRPSDGCMIAGDAFITVKQESALAVATQEQEVHGPPAYFTTDWDKACASVRRLAALRPEYAVTGHGFPMRGDALRAGLENLAAHFEEIAVPPEGRYVH